MLLCVLKKNKTKAKKTIKYMVNDKYREMKTRNNCRSGNLIWWLTSIGISEINLMFSSNVRVYQEEKKDARIKDPKPIVPLLMISMHFEINDSQSSQLKKIKDFPFKLKHWEFGANHSDSTYLKKCRCLFPLNSHLHAGQFTIRNFLLEWYVRTNLIVHYCRQIRCVVFFFK